MVKIEQQILDADICKMVQKGTAKMVAGFQDFVNRTDVLECINHFFWFLFKKIYFIVRKLTVKKYSLKTKNCEGYNTMGLSKKTTCLRGRVAPWPKLISAEMSTIVYDGGRSRKVKTLKIRPPT